MHTPTHKPTRPGWPRWGALLGASLGLISAAGAAAQTASLPFGRSEQAVWLSAGADKWGAAIAAIDRSVACVQSRAPGCDQAIGGDLLDRLRALPPHDQAEAVNGFVNRFNYRSDPDNWARSDHWATAAEFFSRSGDCEDYAIAKYALLRALGTPAHALRVVVVQDLRAGATHAVLALQRGEHWLVLDNQSGAIVPTEALGHYQALLSLNETGLWLLQPVAGVPVAIPAAR